MVFFQCTSYRTTPDPEKRDSDGLERPLKRPQPRAGDRALGPTDMLNPRAGKLGYETGEVALSYVRIMRCIEIRMARRSINEI